MNFLYPGLANYGEFGVGYDTYLLAVAWFTVLTLSTMDESGSFSVKTMQPVWLLIDKSIVLGYELPTNFRGYDIVVKGGGVRVGCAGHDEMMLSGGEYCVSLSLEAWLFGAHLLNIRKMRDNEV